MGATLHKKNIKNSRPAKVSFMLGLLPLLCMIIVTIRDILIPVENNNDDINMFIGINMLGIIGITGVIIAAISLFENKCSKKLGIFAIILNSVIPVFIFVIRLSILMEL